MLSPFRAFKDETAKRCCMLRYCYCGYYCSYKAVIIKRPDDNAGWVRCDVTRHNHKQMLEQAKAPHAARPRSNHRPSSMNLQLHPPHRYQPRGVALCAWLLVTTRTSTPTPRQKHTRPTWHHNNFALKSGTQKIMLTRCVNTVHTVFNF